MSSPLHCRNSAKTGFDLIVGVIAQSEQAGSDEENWLRAEQELLEEQELQER